MLRVLTTQGNTQSAHKLGYPLYTDSSQILSDMRNSDVMIRWGHSGGQDYSMVLNNAESIAENCNKLVSKQTLAGAVQTPAIYTSRIPRGVKAVMRPLEHSQGSDFELVDGPYTIPGGHYASKFISTPKEFRVWFSGRYMLAGKRDPITAQGQAITDPCRSKWGYLFQESVFPVLGAKTQLARQALGLDFGAADVLWSEEDRTYYFLELNTAPSLDHRKVLDFFKLYIPRTAAEKYASTSAVVHIQRT